MKISVIMPNYNHGKYIAQAIESVLNQSHDHLELLIVDDGSEDDSFSIIESYKNHDPRIRIKMMIDNSGFPVAFEEGYRMAKGELVYGLASDDYIFSKDFFKKVVDEFEHNSSIGLVWAITGLFYDTGEHFTDLGSSCRKTYINGKEFLIDFLTGGSFVAGYSAVFKKKYLDKVGGFQFDLGPQCDYFPNHAVPSVFGGSFIPEIMTHARTFRDGSNYCNKTNEMQRIERHAEFEKRMRRVTLSDGSNDELWLAWREKLINDIAPNSKDFANEYFRVLIGQ